MPRLYFEDFEVGNTIDLGERVVDRDEVIAFATAFDPQPFHVDEDAARETPFGGLIASGWHTASMVMRMICDTYMLDSASLGSPGMDSLRWLRPVRPGDTLRATRTVLAARVSQSKPGVGIVTSRFDVRNQHGELVMTMEGPGMFRVRNPAGGGAA